MKRIILEVLSFLFVLLFSYAALTKLFDLEKFTVQLGQSPLLAGLGSFLPWCIIGSELLIASLFGSERYRMLAFYGAFGLMSAFTVYIIILLQFSDYIPCSCGGILEQMGWYEHLVFNLVFCGLSILGIFLQASAGSGDPNGLRKQTPGFSPAKKMVVLTVLCIFLTSGGVVGLLYGVSTDIRKKPGSFVREYPPHPILELASMPIAHRGYYLAGATHDMVYLANRQTPLHILGVGASLTDTVHISLRLSGIAQQRYFRISVVVDSPYFYFADGSIPFLYRGRMTDWSGNNVLRDTLYFSDVVPLSGSSIALRALHGRTQGHVLGKRLLSSRTTQIGYDLLERQGDGVFSTDGTLRYNRALEKLIYVYYYRNSFFVTDTSLTLVYRAHTIDTFRTGSVKFDTVHSERSVRLSAPPLIINHCFATYQQWLFMHSTVAARNENMKRFERSSVIDVYDLPTGTYLLSFYIADARDEKLRDIAIANHKLFALFDHTLVVYDLSVRNFELPQDTKPVSQERVPNT